MREVYQTIWAENKYLVLARNRQAYLDIVELVKEERYEEIYPMLKEFVETEGEFDNYKEAAQEIWGHFKNKERDNSHFFATLNNQNENLRLLWNLTLTYKPVYLLNCRVFSLRTGWNKAWVIRNNRMRLFYWDGEKYFRLKLPAEILQKISNQQTLAEYKDSEIELLEKAIVVIEVDGQKLMNPKIAYALESGLEIE